MKKLKRIIVILTMLFSVPPFLAIPLDIVDGINFDFFYFSGLAYWGLVIVIGFWYLRDTKETK